MAKRRIVPVTRTTGLGPLPKLVAEHAGEQALHHAFHSEGLSLTAAEQTNLFVPHTAMLGVFERAARHVGAREFGLSVGQGMAFPSFGLWSEYCACGATLGEAIFRICDSVGFQQTRSVVTLEREETFAVLRHYPQRLNVANIQHSDHLLYPMLYFLQLFLGAHWRPAWFELNYPRDADAREIETQLPAPVRFGTGAVGIAMPAACLTAPCTWQQSRITLSDLTVEDPVQHFSDPLRSIVALAMLRLMEGKTDLEGTAELAGVSSRTLQRSLGAEGLNYRDLLDRIRSRRAKELLSETTLTITEVALALGYSEHANFTRAFTRWMGQSPFQYRRRSQPTS